MLNRRLVLLIDKGTLVVHWLVLHAVLVGAEIPSKPVTLSFDYASIDHRIPPTIDARSPSSRRALSRQAFARAAKYVSPNSSIREEIENDS